MRGESMIRLPIHSATCVSIRAPRAGRKPWLEGQALQEVSGLFPRMEGNTASWVQALLVDSTLSVCFMGLRWTAKVRGVLRRLGIRGRNFGMLRHSAVSGDEWAIEVITRLCAVVLDLVSVIRTQIIESQAVFVERDQG